MTIGDTAATFGLALLYQNKGMYDLDQSINFFTEAANKGLAVAQHNLATFLFNPNDEPASLKKAKDGNKLDSWSSRFSIWKAVEYYKMAATQGFYQSQVNLCKIYMTGYSRGREHVEVNLTEAGKWLQAAEVAVGKDHPDIVALKREFLEQTRESANQKVEGNGCVIT